MITIEMKRALSGIRIWHIVVFIFMLLFIAVAPPGAQAQIPRYINYQGKLTDANDDPVTGDINITIRIYDKESGGTALWTEAQTTTVTRGIFSILLGNVKLLDSLDFNIPYWYSVEVESDGEMTPRQRLTSVGYAINADKLDGYDASQFLRGDADTALEGNLTISGTITGGANEDITLDPTGTGNIVMKIDSTSGDFKVTDGTTNWMLVDNETGSVTIAEDLTVNGTIHGQIASTSGNSTFSSIVVTGASDLRGNISNSSGAVTVADALAQTGAANQVSFAGNVDAGSGLDVTGALTVSGATTLNSGLDMNSNIDMDYSGDSAALMVTQNSTGPSAQFSGNRVIIGASEASNAYALSTGELYVSGDLEVDGKIYGEISSDGAAASLGATTLASLEVIGASNLHGNVDAGAGIDITGAANFAGGTTYKVDSTGAATLNKTDITATALTSGGTDDYTLNIAQTLNDANAASGSDVYRGIKLNLTETNTNGWNNVYLMDLLAGDISKFKVDNSGNTTIAGSLTIGFTALSEASLIDLTDSGTTTLHSHSGLVPAAHRLSHESAGSDALIFDNLSDGTTYKKFLATERTKLDGIEAGADVTDAANVAAAGAIMTSSSLAQTAGHLYVAENTAAVGSPPYPDSAATLYFGRNLTDDWETIGYDPTLGTKGKFTFSAPLQIEASSPTGITFVEKSSGKSQGLTYDPAADEFSFTGGTLKQQFQNLVRSGSFESYRPSGWYSSRGYYTDMIYPGIAKFGEKSLRVQDDSTFSSDYMGYWIPEGNRFSGNNVTLSIWARCDTGKTATASVGLNINGVITVNNISLTQDWKNFIATYTVPAGTSYMYIYLYGAASADGIPIVATKTNDPAGTGSSYVYYDGITLVEGKMSMPFGPSPIYDAGDQVIGGNLAIGASTDPNLAWGSSYYYNYPRLIFGEPDSNFGGYYGGWNMGSGEMSFRRLGSGTMAFMFNRPIVLDKYNMNSWNNPALFIGSKYWGTPDVPDFAWSTADAYINGIMEVDGGIYGDVMSFYGGVGKTANLLIYSEDFTRIAWPKSGITVTNGLIAPNGTATACKLTGANGSFISQDVSPCSANTAYTFSIYAAPDSSLSAYIYLKSDVDSYWTSKYVDLYDAVGPNPWRRFSVTHTTGAGASTITAKIEFTYSGGAIKVWGAQLKQGNSTGIYLKTIDTAINNSTSLFHGDGSGLINLPASSISSGTAAITGITGDIFTINEDFTGVPVPSQNLSLAFNRGNQQDAAITWNEGSNKFDISNPVNILNGGLTVAGAITANTIIMPTEANITWGTSGKALIAPEYHNAAIYADGSSNSGTMAIKNTDDSSWKNYYEWSARNAALQDYTITVRYEIPQDFSAWAASNAIKLAYVTQAGNATDNKVDAAIYKAGSSTAITTSLANAATSWSEIFIDGSTLGSWSAGDILIMEIKVYSKNGNFARLGDIALNYTR